jgi:hypothetical protein
MKVSLPDAPVTSGKSDRPSAATPLSNGQAMVAAVWIVVVVLGFIIAIWKRLVGHVLG